jgi:hypothetical protein
MQNNLSVPLFSADVRELFCQSGNCIIGRGN